MVHKFKATGAIPPTQTQYFDRIGNYLSERTVAGFLADTTGYSTVEIPTLYVEGARFEVEGFRYEVVASDAETYHLETDGGVRFRVLPSNPITPFAFGATGDGSSNDTIALKVFFEYCISGSHYGFIPAATYIVTLGQLAFDNGFVDTKWPNIDTAGHAAVTFKAAANTDAPFISITNGSATGPTSNVWSGGRLGGISFVKATGDASPYSAMHGLVLRGVEYTEFGYMRGDYLGGDTIHIPRALYNTNNPDPYNVSGCLFKGVEGNRNSGRAFMNDNYVGLAGCTISAIRAIENSSGAFFGQGASNTVHSMSVGSCAGWAVGDQSDVQGGATSRFKLHTAEFDDVQYGIDTSIASQCDYGTHRFVHRHEFGPHNDDGGYWPRVALQIGSATRPVIGLRFKVIDRIERGGVKGDLGKFADFSNAGGNLLDCRIDRQILDNANLGLTREDYYHNFSASSGVQYYESARPIIDTLLSVGSSMAARASGVIFNGGFSGASNNVPYNTLIYGFMDLYDTIDYIYTAQTLGLHRVRATICLTLTAGQRVRLGILVNGMLARAVYRYATSSNNEIYEIYANIQLSPGDKVEITADNNSGSSATITSFGHENDNFLEIDLV